MTFDPKRLAAFVSRKRVLAGEIVAVDRLTVNAENPLPSIHRLSVKDKDGMLMAFDPAAHPGIFARHSPQVGDWLVGYFNADGEVDHISISPKAAFDAGYVADPDEPVELAAGTPMESTLERALDDGVQSVPV
jgi:hypothetical protein